MSKDHQSELIYSMIQHLKSIAEDLLQYSKHEQKAEIVPPSQLADSNDRNTAPRDDSLLVLASLMRHGRVYMTKSDTPTQVKTSEIIHN